MVAIAVEPPRLTWPSWKGLAEAATCGERAAPATTSLITGLYRAVVIFCPCGATKTIWAVPPLGLAWKLRPSRSFAFWNSAPGMDELSGGDAGARVATATTPPSTATHANATYQRCRNANRPTRYRKAATAGSPYLIWDYPARLPAPGPSRRHAAAGNTATETAVRQDTEYGHFRNRRARKRTTAARPPPGQPDIAAGAPQPQPAERTSHDTTP